MPRKAFLRKQAKVDTGHQCFSVVAQATAKICPRPAHRLFSIARNFIEQQNFIAQMHADWKVEKAQYAEFNVANMRQDCSLTAVQRKTAFAEQSWFMMACISHVWISAIVFVPTAKAPPKAGAKEVSYNSLNLAYSGQHPCFGPNWFIQFCHTWRWI